MRYFTEGVVECIEEEPRGERGPLFGARAVVYQGPGSLSLTITHSDARQTTAMLALSVRLGATPRN